MGNIKAKKNNIVNKKALIVTVDIGKIKNTGYWRSPDGIEGKPFEFFNNKSGFNTFWQRIIMVKESRNIENIVVGFEPTGCYGEPLLHYLRKRKVQLVQINPLHTKRIKDLQGNSPNKTDQKDPKVIADIIELGHALSLIVPEGSAAQLRRLTHARERSLKRRTALLNQVQDLIYLIFPEFQQVMKNIKTKSAQHLLKHYPTPQKIIECGLESLTLILRKISNRKLGKKRAEALFEAAMGSVGVIEGRESILLEVKEVLTNIEASNRFLAEIEEHMANYLKQIPYSKYILSLKGVGKITAAGLIGEVGDFSKFSTLSEIMKLAGLDLYEISSGNYKGSRHISKRGRPLLRKFLYFVAIHTVRKGGVMYHHYQRYLQRGMVKIKALVAIARKLLRIIFALVRDCNEYAICYQKPQNLPLKEAA